MKAILRLTIAFALFYLSFGNVKATVRVLDFDTYGNLSDYYGLSFGGDFAIYLIPYGSSYGSFSEDWGDWGLRTNLRGEGWKECTITFKQPGWQFIGAYVAVSSGTVQFRMYKSGKLVGTSIIQGETQFKFVPSDYDGEVDAVGIWGNTGYYLLDDFKIATVPSAPQPHRAQALLTITEGKITGLRILDYGFGYKSAPTVTVTDSTGRGAQFHVTVTNNIVYGISISSGGSNYSAGATLKIALPELVSPIKASASRYTLKMNLEIGKSYQIYSSADLTVWTRVGEPFTATTPVATVEVEAASPELTYQVRKLN